VLALEVVLADGRVIESGSRAKKSSAGYDLTSLFVGCEGTLGVITRLTVRLHGIPERVLAARAVFASVEAACETAAAVIASGVPVERCELVDGYTVRALNAYKGTSYPEQPMLLLEFGGSPASVEADRQLVEELARECGCSAFEAETDSRGRARLWEARHDAAHAIAHSAPGFGMKSTDVCVPISQLPGAIRFGRETIERHGMRAAILGHVGDGNYHAAFMIDPADPDGVELAERVNDEIVNDALARGGTCTGEHGIGVGKIPHLEREHGDLVPLYRALKQTLDPNGILNPGKVVAPK
jgi:D-lactate dehydrogenase (cytochrome)